MTKKEVLETLNSIKYQYEDCVRIANSPNATEFQKESLNDNLSSVLALEYAIKAIEKYGLSARR